MKIEITEKQQQALLAIIGSTQIQGKDAQVIIDLVKAIQTPINKEVIK